MHLALKTERDSAAFFPGGAGNARRIVFCFVLMLLGLLPRCFGIAVAQESLCAEVKIVIEQKLSLERQAFDAHMVINNGLDNAALQNVSIDLYFLDRNNQPVQASSDPGAIGARFFLRTDSIKGLGAIDGSASLPPKGLADIHWLIIPAAGTGGTDPKGQLYYVGARVRYTLNGQASTVDVTPDYVIVKPQPLLKLDYFLPRDVHADDPFTPEVEPEEPFTLGVRISNVGGGSAPKTRIESAQPKIVENRQGLLIDFRILGGYVADQPAGKSLMLDFGDIAPGRAAMGRWSMVTTLAGRFVELGADYAHADSLGGAVTSLIQNVVTHTLLRDVRVDLPGRDSIRDFLARDTDILRVYESDGVDSEVIDQSASATLRATATGQELKFQPVQGFAYVRVADPFRGSRLPGQILRSDGKPLPPENVWLSKTRNPDLSWSYELNLFDVNSTGTYSIAFTDTPMASLSGVAYKDINGNGVRDAGEPGLGTLAIYLKGVDDAGVSVSGTAYADATGAFSFVRLTPGRYQLESAVMDGLGNGVWLAGSAGGVARPGSISNIQLAAGANAQGYLLAKRADTANGKDKADLSIQLAAAPVKLRQGNTVTFSLRAANAGPANASDVSVNLALPAGWLMQSAVTGKGAYTNGVWKPGTLGAGESATLTVTAKAGSLADSSTVGAQIGAATEDPVPANNTASVLLRKDGGDMGASQSLPRGLRLLVLASCANAQGQADKACAESKAVFAQNYLTRLGYRSSAFTTVAQMRKALRANAYNGIWLNAAGVEPDDLLLGELREAVRRGSLLLVDGTQSDRLAQLADVLGATPAANVAGESLEIIFNGGTPGVRLGKGSVRSLQRSGASELAHVAAAGAGADTTVAASNAFARGRALLLGFDLLAGLQQSAQEGALAAFLGQQLAAVPPMAASPLLARTALVVESVLDNRESAAVDTRLTLDLPPDTSLLEALPAPTSLTGQQALWKATLAAGQTQKTSFTLRLPKASTAMAIKSRASRDDDGSLFGDFTQSIDVLGADVLLPRVLAAIDTLAGADPALTERVARARTLAREAQTAFGKEDHERVIAGLIELQGVLKPLAVPGIEALRQDIADWLGIAGMNWQENYGAGVASRIVATAGGAQATTVGKAFSAVLQATVTDVNGAGVAGADVLFRLPAGGASASFPGGATSASARTDANGVARSPVLTANLAPGAYLAEAVVAGLAASAAFPLENLALAPQASRLEIVSGTPQESPVGKLFAALKVRVRDQNGAPMPGVSVVFNAPASGATARFLGVDATTSATASASSDSAGIATSPILTANTIIGSYQLTALADGLAQPALFQLSNSEDPDSVLTLTQAGGSGQIAVINTAFPEPLALLVSNRHQLPRSGVAVRFSAPASEPAARFPGGQQEAVAISGADGVARSPRLTAGSRSGTYRISASAEQGAAALAFDLQNVSPGSDGKNFAGVTATGSGSMLASISGGGAGCVFKAEATRLLAADQAPGVAGKTRFPHGLFEYVLRGCVPGSRITVSSTWPALRSNAGYRKIGPTPASAGKPVSYTPGELQVRGNTISYTVVDGGSGDDDLLADGVVHELGGPALNGAAKTGGWLWLLLD